MSCKRFRYALLRTIVPISARNATCSEVARAHQFAGKGSFGSAVLCTHIKTGTKVCIKLIDVSGMSHEERRAARGESILLASLNKHPSIVHHFESFEGETLD